MFWRAVCAAGTHGTHGEGSPGARSGREGAPKLGHGQARMSDLVHGLCSKKSELRVGIC